MAKARDSSLGFILRFKAGGLGLGTFRAELFVGPWGHQGFLELLMQGCRRGLFLEHDMIWVFP